jgi:hypothetical protein
VKRESISRLAWITLCAVALGPVLFAHHILGIPHYAYDEEYPQAPVITYRVEAGPYLLNLTGYPGKPTPQELCQMHVYVRRTADEKDIFAGPIQVAIHREKFLGEECVFGPRETRFDENLHKFSPVYGEEGRYRVRLEMMLEGEPYEIDFPMIVGNPPDPWTPILSWLAAAAFLIVVVRAIKIKMHRGTLTAA